MNLLLDSHAFLWFVTGDDKLSRKARSAIEQADRGIAMASVDALANLLRGDLAHVNLIPMNAVAHTPWVASPMPVIERFAARLRAAIANDSGTGGRSSAAGSQLWLRTFRPRIPGSAAAGRRC